MSQSQFTAEPGLCGSQLYVGSPVQTSACRDDHKTFQSPWAILLQA